MIDNHVWEEEFCREKPAFWGASFWRVVKCIDIMKFLTYHVHVKKSLSDKRFNTKRIKIEPLARLNSTLRCLCKYALISFMYAAALEVYEFFGQP